MLWRLHFCSEQVTEAARELDCAKYFVDGAECRYSSMKRIAEVCDELWDNQNPYCDLSGDNYPNLLSVSLVLYFVTMR